jgi:hypothetical protein
VSDAGKYSPGQIKAQVAHIAQPVVDVIAENIQKVHIAEDMHYAAVQESISDELPEEKMFRREHKPLHPRHRLYFETPKPAIADYENQNIGGNQQIIGVRCTPMFQTGPNRYHK